MILWKVLVGLWLVAFFFVLLGGFLVVLAALVVSWVIYLIIRFVVSMLHEDRKGTS